MTIQQYLQANNIQLARPELLRISTSTSNVYKQIFSIRPEKIEQIEDGIMYQVNQYPDEFSTIIGNTMSSYTK